MLARLLIVLLFISSSVLIGVSSETCQREITVDVTSNGSLTLPEVSVTLVSTRLAGSDITWISENEGTNVTSSSFKVNTMNGYLGDNFTVTDGQSTLNFYLDFDSDAMACHYMTLDVEYSEGAALNFSCLPVTSCNKEMPTFTSIVWKKSFSRDEQYVHELSSGIYEPPEFTSLRMDRDRNEIMLSSDNLNGTSYTDAVLDIRDPSMLSVGYYDVYGSSGNSVMELLHSFTVFRTASRVSSSGESLSVIKGTEDPYKGIYCVFRAFPPATVTWVRGSDRGSAQPIDEGDRIKMAHIIESNTNSNYTVSNGVVDFTYTMFGGIVFEELQYEDAGFYYCSASNGYSTSSEEHIRLRVRDPLRPLWPALGIIGVFIITALFITAGAIFDKLRDSKSATLDSSEINAAYSVRSQRVSVADDDGSPKRRTSSTVKLLPRPE